MYKNYFILNRFILEAKNELNGFKAVGAFSQDKDKLLIHFASGIEDKYIEISANPNFAYISLRKNFSRAKKNTVEFFSSYFPAVFNSFEIAESDRVLRLNFESSSMYFAIRGRYTNLYFTDITGKADTFKKSSSENIDLFIKEVKDLEFISHFNYPVIKVDENNFRDEIKKKYPIVGNEIILETEHRHEVTGKSKTLLLNNIINEIELEKPCVFVDENLSEIHLAVETLSSFPFTDKSVFESVLPAINFYIIKKYSLESSETKEKLIRKHLDRELKKLAGKLNSLKIRIDKGSREEEYNKYGNLLLINLHSFYKGMESAELTDIYNENNIIKINLDKTLSPQKNVDIYFNKAKSEKINYEKSKQLFDSVKKEYDKLKIIETKLTSVTPDQEQKTYLEIMKELKIKENINTPEKDDIRDKFKQYIVSGKYNVYVGRDSQNNDLLTTRFAKQNDYWFHARSVPGSHVVLRVENTKEAVPKDVLKKTAAIAAYHSKAKTAGMVPVSYALKKYVVKKKGMEPGKVALLKEETLIVKPEVPAGVEYVSND